MTPFTTIFAEFEERASTGIEGEPIMILKTSIRSALFLRSSGDHKPNLGLWSSKERRNRADLTQYPTEWRNPNSGVSERRHPEQIA